MSTADRIGLLPVFGATAGHSWWLTLFICWAVTPLAMIVIAPVFETRFLPLNPRRQFLAFFPGDLFLGAMVTGLLMTAKLLPDRQAWYNAVVTHLLILVCCAIVASALTFLEVRDAKPASATVRQAGYSKRAILSPTKLYHNIVLYVGYGYVAVSTMIADAAGGQWGWMIIALIPGLIWLGMMQVENRTLANKPDLRLSKAQGAHISDWRPFWR